MFHSTIISFDDKYEIWIHGSILQNNNDKIEKIHIICSLNEIPHFLAMYT